MADLLLEATAVTHSKRVTEVNRKIYLSARMSRQEEMRAARGVLEEAGYDFSGGYPAIIVCSRWLDEPFIPNASTFEACAHKIAFRDVCDIDDCDTLVRFADDLRPIPNSDTTPGERYVPASWATGGRMWEMGYAYAKGKRIIVVGGHQSVFDWLPSVDHVKDLEELCLLLTKRNARKRQ